MRGAEMKSRTPAQQLKNRLYTRHLCRAFWAVAGLFCASSSVTRRVVVRWMPEVASVMANK